MLSSAEREKSISVQPKLIVILISVDSNTQTESIIVFLIVSAAAAAPSIVQSGIMTINSSPPQRYTPSDFTMSLLSIDETCLRASSPENFGVVIFCAVVGGTNLRIKSVSYIKYPVKHLSLFD